MTNQTTPLQWKIDECSSYFGRLRVRGWCFAPGRVIKAIEVIFPEAKDGAPRLRHGLASPDMAAAVGAEAHHARFDDWIAVPGNHGGRDFALRVTFTDGSSQLTSSVFDNARAGDEAHGCWSRFLEMLQSMDAGAVLEIGSRARSGHTVKHLVPEKHRYVGMDILAGPNVDVVGDAHEAAAVFPTQRFGAIFSRSVFEHLAMPWKVVLEMNRILQPGGLMFVMTHQTWVLHEEPWDFWRYSRHTWPSLFNRPTGFEIVEVAQGEPARIHAMWDSPIVYDMASHPAYLCSAVIARKIAETSLTWPVSAASLTEQSYPPGELRMQ